MMKEVTDLLETVAVRDMFPRLRWVDWATGLDAKMRRVAGKLDDVLERALQEHEKKPEDEDEAADLLDDLLLVIKEEGEGLNLDRIDVKGLILVSSQDQGLICMNTLELCTDIVRPVSVEVSSTHLPRLET